MVGKRSVIIGMTNEPGGTAYDRTFKVDLLHIVGIKELNAPSFSSGNGSAS